MQEDIENRTVTMTISGAKFTGRMLKSAIAKLLAHMRNGKNHSTRSKDITVHGKQTVKQLVGQNQGVSNIEIADSGVKEFERIARKYGVDFAVKKVKGDRPKYLVFFKARDADALTAAFTEYTGKQIHKAKRPSVLKTLRSFQALVSGRNRDPIKNKDKEISR